MKQKQTQPGKRPRRKPGKVIPPMRTWGIQFGDESLSSEVYDDELDAVRVAKHFHPGACAAPVPVVILTLADYRRLVRKGGSR